MAEQTHRAEALAVPVAQVAPLRRPRRRAAGRTRSARVVAVAAVVAAALGGAYVFARETSAFALRTVEVEGAPPPVSAQIRAVLETFVGRSLVSLDSGEVARSVRSIPAVASASVDRGFPHSLRVSVQLDREVAVARQGTAAWTVGADGRVLRRLTSRPYPGLPRIWLPRTVDVLTGSTLGRDAAQAVVVASALTRSRVPLAVRSIEAHGDQLDVVLRSGMLVRLGDAGDLAVKLAVARRIVPLAPGARYVDVTVPERAVASPNPQAAG